MYGPALTAGPAALVRDSASEHVHPSLGAEHSLLIGRKDQGFCSGHKVQLGSDVPFSIKEQHPQQPTCGIQKVHRDDADWAVPLPGFIWM